MLETTKTRSNWTLINGQNLKTTTPYIYTALIRLFRAIVELSFDVMFNMKDFEKNMDERVLFFITIKLIVAQKG